MSIMQRQWPQIGAVTGLWLIYGLWLLTPTF